MLGLNINYSIPNNIATTTTNGNTSFMLLSTEFRNQGYLYGFQLYSSLNGSINIKVNFFINF